MLDKECIVAIVERGQANKVVEAAKTVGASGATVFYGRGTGESEVKKFLNVHIESSKEIIILLSDTKNVRTIITAMVEAGRLKEPGTGIVFSLPVANLVGHKFREQFEEDQ